MHLSYLSLYPTLFSSVVSAHLHTSLPLQCWRSFRDSTMAPLVKRQVGYGPATGVCGTGETCAQACGDDFETCASRDVLLLCFDAKAGQTCCPNGSGAACDADYYCAQDAVGKTFCCPDDIDLAGCAAANSAGPLLSASSPTSSTIATIKTFTITSVTSLVVTISTTSLITANASSTRFPSVNITAIFTGRASVNEPSLRHGVLELGVWFICQAMGLLI